MDFTRSRFLNSEEVSFLTDGWTVGAPNNPPKRESLTGYAAAGFDPLKFWDS